MIYETDRIAEHSVVQPFDIPQSISLETNKLREKCLGILISKHFLSHDFHLKSASFTVSQNL